MKQPTPIQIANRELMGRMLVFCRQYPRLTFAQWPPESMAGYLNWLGAQDALRFTWGPGPSGPEITGLMLGWRTTAAVLAHPDFARCSYNFARPLPEGDCFYCDVLIGYPGTLSMLVADHQWRNPDWRRLTYAAVRRGKLRVYPNPERFLNRLERI